MFTFLILEILSITIGIIALAFLILALSKQKTIRQIINKRTIYIPIIIIIIAGFSNFIFDKTYPPNFAMPAFMHSQAPGGLPPSLPFSNILNFFIHTNDFEKVTDISANPSEVPTEAQKAAQDGLVHIYLKAQEVIAETAPGIYQNYWTYNKQVPGPILRIQEGDTIEFTLENDKSSLHNHNIDLHAVNGPGGGATVTNVAPGETKTFKFKALNPGLYMYHCAMPNVSTHNSHGQYGLILVDSKDSKLTLSKVDKEFYLMQGEFYTKGKIGKLGLMQFDPEALINGTPTYIVFNGKIESSPRLKAKAGDKIRLYVGNGGVNLISSFHIIGEIFDKVYPEAAMGEGSSIFKNVQTTAILPGGATIVEFTVDVPGNYLIVDHALARMNKGAWATLEVTGPENPEIFSPISATGKTSHSQM